MTVTIPEHRGNEALDDFAIPEPSMKRRTSSWLGMIALAALTARPACGRRSAAASEHRAVRPGPPMNAADAAAGFRLPEGFRVSVFAAEPDVQNPIAMAWDAPRATVGRRELHLRGNRHRSLTCASAIASSFLKTAIATAGSTGAPSSPTTFSDSPASSSEAGACGSCARLACCSFPTAMATTSPMDRPRSSSTVSRSPRRTITPSPTACAGVPTAGCTAAAAHRRRARSDRPGRPSHCAYRSAGASGGFTPDASSSRSSRTVRPTPGVMTGTRSASFSSSTPSTATCGT